MQFISGKQIMRIWLEQLIQVLHFGRRGPLFTGLLVYLPSFDVRTSEIDRGVWQRCMFHFVSGRHSPWFPNWWGLPLQQVLFSINYHAEICFRIISKTTFVIRVTKIFWEGYWCHFILSDLFRFFKDFCSSL